MTGLLSTIAGLSLAPVRERTTVTADLPDTDRDTDTDTDRDDRRGPPKG
ncbi:hypothetical protein ACFYVR_01105 [Rhodococcus sp. NPDC003318]